MMTESQRNTLASLGACIVVARGTPTLPSPVLHRLGLQFISFVQVLNHPEGGLRRFVDCFRRS